MIKIKKQRLISLRVIVTPFNSKREQGYSIEVPALQGCLSGDETLAKGLRMIRDAVECYLDADAEISPSPIPKGSFEKTLYLGWMTRDGKPLNLSSLPPVIPSGAELRRKKKRKSLTKSEK